MTPIDKAVQEVMNLMGEGHQMSGAVREVADALGLGRRALYEAVLRR